MNQVPESRSSNPGFSVIEVLIAMLIIGLVMSAIYGALVVTIQTKREIETEIDEAKHCSTVFEALQRDLRGACLLGDGLALFKCSEGNLTQGEGGKINFVASRWSSFPDEARTGSRKEDGEEGEEAQPRSPICEIGYFLKPDPDNRKGFLLYRREDYYVDSDFEKGGLYLKLSSRVKELQLRFVRGDEVETGQEPDDSWDGEEESALPAAVQVRLVMAVPSSEEDRGEGKEKVFEATVPILAGGGSAKEDEETPAEGEEEEE